MLESRDSFFEVVTIGVGGAGVLVQTDWLSQRRLRECGRERDRGDDCAGGGIERRASMDSERAKVVYWGGYSLGSLDAAVLGGMDSFVRPQGQRRLSDSHVAGNWKLVSRLAV